MNTLSLKKTAEFYADIAGHWLFMRDRLTIPWLEIRYEDIVDDLETAVGPVFEFMGLEWTTEASQYYLHARNRDIATPSYSQVRQPLYRSSVGRWHNYESHMEKIVSVLDPFISSFGYQDR